MLRRLVLACAVFASACAPAVDTTIGDAAITAAVVTALLNNPDVDGTQVNVRTDSGVVYLEGTQPTPAARSEVVMIARGVEGVRDVQATIEVDRRATVEGSAEPGAVGR